MRRSSMAAVALLVGAAAVPRPQSSDPPLGYTGAAGQPDCTSCHLGNEVNAFGGTLSLSGLPDRFTPGRSYVLTLTLSAEETSVAGFQLAVLGQGPGSSKSAGTLAPVDGRTVIRDSVGVQYAYHSREGTTPISSDLARWSFEWSAPAAGEAIVVHAAANSGNGDESPLGDLVFVGRWSSEPTDGAAAR